MHDPASVTAVTRRDLMSVDQPQWHRLLVPGRFAGRDYKCMMRLPDERMNATNSLLQASHAGAIETIAEVRRQMFLDFCSALEKRHITYVILAGYRDYPDRIASDVDFMVSEDDFERLPAILSSVDCIEGARVVQMLQHETCARYFVMAKQRGSRIAYLHPDAAANYRLNARLWLRSADVLASRRRSSAGFWIPAAAVEFEYYFVKRAEKRSLEALHLDQLAARIQEDESGCMAVLSRLLPTKTALDAAKAIAITDVDWFLVNRDQLYACVRAAVPRESLLMRMRSHLEELARRWGRVMRPTGFVIAVLGPDGSGKTTVINHLEAEFAPAFRCVKRFHFRPYFGKPRESTVVEAPHAAPPRSWMTSAAKIAMFLADYWISWLAVIQPAKDRSTLIIFDRYYHDMLVDCRRYRLPESFPLARWAAHLVPHPDLWMVLSAPAEELVERKGEISHTVARQLSAAYSEFAGRLHNSVVIDSRRPLEATLEAAAAEVRRRLERRSDARLRHLVKR